MPEGVPISLSVDELMAQARADTGIDIVDHDVVEPLSALRRSLCEDSCLHQAGAIAQQKKLIRLLSNRLRMQRDFARHPEIAEQKIHAPIIVHGMPRSGTTKTQKVLSVSGDFNWLPFWQSHSPSLMTGLRGESPDARIKAADDYCRWHDAASPMSKLGHSFEVFEPEEESPMMEGCFRFHSFAGYTDVPSYMQWLSMQSPKLFFEYLRDSLKYLQWQGMASEHKRWILKAPVYYGLERELLDVFPGASFVMVHRSPLSTIPSACKLAALFRIPYTDLPVDPIAFSGGFMALMKRHLVVRQSNPHLAFLDLSFDEITHSMDEAVEKIYAHIGVQLTEVSRARMSAWNAENTMHKGGVFEYSLEEFGMSEAQIRQDMADYFEFMKMRFGK